MQSEILHGLGGLENDVAKFLMLLLDIGHHGMFDADAHLKDCLPSLVTRGSDHQPDIYLLRHGAVDGGEGIYVIMVLGSVVLDDVTHLLHNPATWLFMHVTMTWFLVPNGGVSHRGIIKDPL
jgi:hypothetical protein